MKTDIFQSLWLGKRLSVMEQLSIRSFLDQGYSFHLYTYQDVENIPQGTTVRPGDEILPADEIFCYQSGYGKGSYSAFSNCFRYKLLLDRGGWWTDLDSVCLRPLDFDDQHVLGNERAPDGRCQPAAGLIKAPPGSPLIAYCWDACRKVDRSRIVWGQIGPRLIAEAVGATGVPVRILDPDAFYPIDYWNVWQLISAEHLPRDCYAIHLWNSRWRREQLEPDAVYASSCIYEQLKRRYGTVSPHEAGRGPGWRSLARHLWRQLKSPRLTEALPS
jgi:hypothetical protein